MLSKPTYLVTIATSHQGKSVCTNLLSQSLSVHAFVCSLTSPEALRLQSLGCTLFLGSPDDPSTIIPAIKNCTGIFLNFFPGAENVQQAQNFLSAAVEAGVESVVVSTALNTSMHPLWLEQDPNYPLRDFYETKFKIEQAVIASGVKYQTFLRPGWLMHNFLEPLWRSHFPRFQSEHILDVAYEPGTRTSLFDAADVGKFAVAAFLDPDKFDGEVLELGNEQLHIEDVATLIGIVTDVQVGTHYCDDKEIEEWARKGAGALAIRRWGNKEGMYTCEEGV